MSFIFRVESIAGRPGPLRALVFTCTGQWVGGELGYLLGIDAQLKFRDRVVCECASVRVQLPEANRALLRRDMSFRVDIAALLSSAAIDFLEDHRGEGDVQVQLEVQCRWQDAKRSADGGVMAGDVYWNLGVANVRPIPRSDWLARLHEMEWSEIELFEVNTLPMSASDALMASIQRLREAETALRTADHAQVLAKCRAALESAAKHVGQTNDAREGFSILLSRAFPEDAAKREEIDTLVKGLSAYFHIGRHERYPAVHVTRAESQFALTTTLGLFSLLSQQLAK